MNNKIKLTNSENLPCQLAIFKNYKCILESGFNLENFHLAFKTYGKLNKTSQTSKF